MDWSSLPLNVCCLNDGDPGLSIPGNIIFFLDNRTNLENNLSIIWWVMQLRSSNYNNRFVELTVRCQIKTVILSSYISVSPPQLTITNCLDTVITKWHNAFAPMSGNAAWVGFYHVWTERLWEECLSEEKHTLMTAQVNCRWVEIHQRQGLSLVRELVIQQPKLLRKQAVIKTKKQKKQVAL